jgi:tetratricopeptide (TPR) repeat protein
MGFVGDDRLLTIPALGAGEPASRKWPGPQSPCSYSASSVFNMVVVSGRRFLLCRDALREIDDDGKVLRTWAMELRQRPSAGPDDLPQHEILLLNDVPDPMYCRSRGLAQDSSHLFFVDSFILCYETATDTWYGPLETEPWTSADRAVSGDCGIWFSSNMGLIYLSTADFIATARSAGRAATGQQFRQMRDEQLASLGPLEQAKGAASMRQWEKARGLCANALEKDPASAEAILLMGLLHESCCLNQPDKALEYYARLAAVENNPPAAFTGLVHQYRMNIEAKRYAEALRVGKLIERDYPRNSMGETLGEHNRWLEKQVSPKKETGK